MLANGDGVDIATPTRVPYWSNPSKTYTGVCSGTTYTLPMGTTNWNDVARVWRERAGTVAGFKTPTFTVTISGPSSAPCATGTWTANVANGTAPYTYKWYHMWDCSIAEVPCNTWNPVGTNSSTLQMYLCGGNSILRVDVTDAQGKFATDQHYVTGSGGAIASQAAPPEHFSWSQNYPNPFNPETEIAFSLHEPSRVHITIVDIVGREVATIADGQFAAGDHRVRWSGKNLADQSVSSGTYFCRISATGTSGQQFTKVMKMTLMK